MKILAATFSGQNKLATFISDALGAELFDIGQSEKRDFLSFPLIFLGPLKNEDEQRVKAFLSSGDFSKSKIVLFSQSWGLDLISSLKESAFKATLIDGGRASEESEEALKRWANRFVDVGMAEHQRRCPFPIGIYEESKGSFIFPISEEPKMYQETFAPGQKSRWHIHHAAAGGGQIVLCLAGRGLYGESFKDDLKLYEGEAVKVEKNFRHFHGADDGSWYSQLVLELPGKDELTVTLEEVK